MLSMGCVHINVVKHVEICTRVNMRLSIYLYNYLGGGGGDMRLNMHVYNIYVEKLIFEDTHTHIDIHV